ncbi:MAG TPA: hypothetical protein VG838_06050 [Opitutaceae bacterium]|nr:hypothetical protein [Opitutaceae bacterium]
MHNFCRLALLPLPALLLSAARADINPALVGADAQWVVSCDLNTLRDTTLGKGLMDLARKQMKPDASGQPAGFAIGDVRINFEKLFDTVGSITAYGANFSPDPKLIDGVLVIQGSDDLRKILEAAAIQATISVPEQVKEVKDLPFTAYEIAGEEIVAFPPEPVILLSKLKPRLIKARDVVRGAAPSLAKSPNLPLAAFMAQAGHSFAMVASVTPPEKLFPQNGPQTRILQLLSAGMIATGEEDSRTVTHMQLVANSDESGEKLAKILQGMVAMMSLAETNDKQLTEFMQSTTVERNNRTISLRAAYSSDRLLQMIENTRQAMKPAMAAATATKAAAPAPQPGRVVANWTGERAIGGGEVGAAQLEDHAVEKVHLVNGATITLTVRRDLSGQPDPTQRPSDLNNAPTFDCVDILPASGGGAPLHFEAESMRLQNGTRVQSAPYASRGRLVAMRGSFGAVQFDFPGEDSDYQLHVRYVNPQGKATMGVNVKDPEPAPASASDSR